MQLCGHRFRLMDARDVAVKLIDAFAAFSAQTVFTRGCHHIRILIISRKIFAYFENMMLQF